MSKKNERKTTTKAGKVINETRILVFGNMEIVGSASDKQKHEMGKDNMYTVQ